MTPQQIRSLRKKMGLSRREFALRVGFKGQRAYATVYKLEKGIIRPSATTMLAMQRLDMMVSLTH